MEESTCKTFPFFPQLQEELQIQVLQFVVDSPFERTSPADENYPISFLTHVLPRVCKKFHSYSQLDCFWKSAIERRLASEPLLWKEGIHRLCGTSPNNAEFKDESTCQLIERTNTSLDNPSYKLIYQKVVSNYLRLTTAVFYMPGSINLGEPYGLHFFEPRYRFMIAEIMRDQTEEARHGGRIRGEVLFVHANRTPLARNTPAILVRVLRCDTYPDHRADVLLLPFAHVTMEKLWLHPTGGNLYHCQCLRMGQQVTHDLNHLTRQEALASVMERLTEQFIAMEDDDDPQEEGEIIQQET
jgi:hypothetical protein